MHYIALILSAPNPVTADNYHRKLYAWGDGVYLADTPAGKVWSFWARHVGHDRAALDRNLRRIGQMACKTPSEHSKRIKHCYKRALLSLWTGPNGKSFEEAICDLDNWKKNWKKCQATVAGSAEEHWAALTGLFAHLNAGSGAHRAFKKLTENIDSYTDSWQAFLAVKEKTGPIPMRKFRVLVGREIINKFCLKRWERELLRSADSAKRPSPIQSVETWCQRVNASELTANQLERFWQLLTSAARLWHNKRNEPLALVDEDRIRCRADDRYAILGSYTREGQRQFRTHMDRARETQHPKVKQVTMGAGALCFFAGAIVDQVKVIKNVGLDTAKGVTGLGNADPVREIREELEVELSQKRPNPEDAVNWLKKQLFLHGYQKF